VSLGLGRISTVRSVLRSARIGTNRCRSLDWNSSADYLYAKIGQSSEITSWSPTTRTTSSRSTMRSLRRAPSFERVGGDAVDVAQAPVGFLVDEGDGVGREERAVGAGAFESVRRVLGGVAEGGLAEREPGVDAGPEGAILGEGEALPGLGEPDCCRATCLERAHAAWMMGITQAARGVASA